MEDLKYYYEILVQLPSKYSSEHEDIIDVYFWVRDEKIDYSNNKELVKFIKNNFTEIKNYPHIKKITAQEIDKGHLDSLCAWYDTNNIAKDFTIINN